jgi:hypothetical protein
MSDIIDINIYPTVETISLTIAPNLTTINVNTVSGGGGAVSSVNGQTGVVVLNQDDVLDGTTYKQYSQTEKTKLAGIAAGAEVNVNADWNAVSGDALILNKPTIPSAATFVPYSGATQDVNLGEFGIQLGNLEFDLTPTNVPTGVGSMVWNDTAGTLDLKLKGGAVTLQIGQETVARVVNKTATNITLLESNYQIVRVTGAQGQRPKVDLALANNDLNSTTTLGLVTENILNNAEGFITTSGQVQQINTTGSLQGETWVDGDVLYLSGTVAGQATNIKPAAPIHTVIIGFVEYAHINQGKIFVKVDNGYELEELHNVSAIAPNNNEVLTYDTPTLLWKPKTIATALGFTPENVANKENTLLDNSATKYPTNNLVKTFVTDNYMQVILNCNVLGTTVNGGTNIVMYQVDVPANTFSDLDAFEIEALSAKVGVTAASTIRIWTDTASTFNSGTAQFLAISASLGTTNLFQTIKREFHVRGSTIKCLANTVGIATDEATSTLAANPWASYTFNPAVANTLYFTVTGNAADTFTKQNFKITRYKNKSTI